MAVDLLVNQNAESFDISNPLSGFSRVVIKTGLTDSNGREISYIAGNTSGRTLEINNPWGNQSVADNILMKINGWSYQPFESGNALVNPAFEVGDSVLIDNVFSGVYDSRVKFSKLFASDVKAPADKEINHEYNFESKENREFTRKLNDAVARLNFFSDRIEAKVDENGGNSSFGWNVTSSAWTVFNQDGNLFRINASGAYVKGEIRADSGKIGDFNIGTKAIYKNISSFGGSQSSGVYIGPDGIQLGNKFKVDANGNMTASSGTFTGNISAKNITYGGTNGTLSGSAISEKSLGTSQLTSGVNTSLGYANLFNSATVDGTTQFPNYFKAGVLSSTGDTYLNINGGSTFLDKLYVKDGETYSYRAGWKSMSVITSVGQTQNWVYVVDYEGQLQKVLLYNGTNVTSNSATIKYLGR